MPASANTTLRTLSLRRGARQRPRWGAQLGPPARGCLLARGSQSWLDRGSRRRSRRCGTTPLRSREMAFSAPSTNMPLQPKCLRIIMNICIIDIMVDDDDDDDDF